MSDIGLTKPAELSIKTSTRIQHAEDIIFWEGSKGASRVLKSLINLEKNDYKKVTVKWDGSPAVVFGRDYNGDFVFTDKSGFYAKGYSGWCKSADELESMLSARPGAARNPDSYYRFIYNMKKVFAHFEKSLPKDFVGFFKGDILYFNTPIKVEEEYIFKPNVVEYRVAVDSELGQQISQSLTGVVVHRTIDVYGEENSVTDYSMFQSGDLLILPTITAQAPLQVNSKGVRDLKSFIKKNSTHIDSMLDTNMLAELKIKDLPTIFYTYTNSKVDSGLENLGKDFMQWLSNSNVSTNKQKNIYEYIQKNLKGFGALWTIVTAIQDIKDDIIDQLDFQNMPVNQSMNGEKGGEGYVLSHPQGDIKLVPRRTFSKINRSIER